MGSGDGNGMAVEENGAERQYIEAKTSVWWDIENCQVPKVCDAHAIAQNMRSSLIKMNYCGQIQIFVYGDTNRIPQSVQHALSSTGITLNHVPAGVKDASDKKILVDMLFWAVDNPAPANYLLISGDRDFSNALHQLRMRRYNILLAQPQNASAALVAAAKTVWLWTSILAGGPPLTRSELPQDLTNGSTSSSDSMKNQVSEPMHINQTMNPENDNPVSGNQKILNPGKNVDNKYKGKQPRKVPTTQPNISRSSSAPAAGCQENKSNGSSQQPQPQPQPPYVVAAPHELLSSKPNLNGPIPNFLPPNPDTTWSDGKNIPSNYQQQYSQPSRPNNIPVRADYFQTNVFPPNSQTHGYHQVPFRPDGSVFTSGPQANVSDFGKLSILEYPNSGYGTNYQQRNGNGGESRPNSYTDFPNPPRMNPPPQNMHIAPNPPFYHGSPNSKYPPRGPEFPPPSPPPMATNGWGTSGVQKPSEYVQGLIGVILLALNTLKIDKMIPNEANITDCIRYGDLKHRNTDVRKALDSAIEYQMVVKHSLGALNCYLGKTDKLWKCVNPMERKQYPKTVLDGIYIFLSSPGGRSALMASHCRYEAASILKKSCLKDLVLGDVLQILNMVITLKRWITVHQNGWHPIAITLGSEADSSTHPGA